MTEQTIPLGERLKYTKTRCTTCFAECDGEVWRVDSPGKTSIISMLHRCPDHGEHATLLSADARYYWLAQGDPSNSCCSAAGSAQGSLGTNAATSGALYDKLSSCISLIEIVDSCNISCPTCFPASPLGKGGERLKYHSLETLKQRIERVIEMKGEIEILQLSGGEPTLHPQLNELLVWAGNHPKIQYLFLNTNGIRFVRDEKFARSFGSSFPKGKMLLYLQYDGPQSEGQVELRGVDLREIRDEVIAWSDSIGLPVMLVMTVTTSNVGFAYQAVEAGLKHRHVRAVHFQPVFLSGRTPSHWKHMRERPITTADVIASLINGSNGLLTADDFTPLPCGDPNCHSITGVLRPKGLPMISLSKLIDVQKLGSLKDKIHYELEDLIKCGCDNHPLGEALKAFALTEEDAFAISIKPFMDARTWDKDRTDRCCTHVITPSGELESFCRYYSGFSDTSSTSR